MIKKVKVVSVILAVLALIVVFSCTSDNEINKQLENLTTKEKLVVYPKIGIEITTGYITDEQNRKIWQVKEVEYDGKRYLILYPLNDIANRRNVIMVRK